MTTRFQHPQRLLESVGQRFGPTDWFVVERGRIEAFARATSLPAGARAAPEYLTLSLVNMFLPQLVEVRGASMGIHLGCERVRFPAAVAADARVRGHGELIAARAERESVQAVIRVTIELEAGDAPACIADTISRYYPM